MANSNIDYGVEYQDRNGAWIQAIAIATAAPLDYRLKVKYFSDLTNAETWQVQGTGSGNKGFNTAYHGMLSYVANDSESGSSGLYVLTPGEDGSASADALVAANWVKISQTDATIEELRELIDTKQSEAISVSGLTGNTVQKVLEDISARIAGAATGGNLEALGNRVTAVETNVNTLSTALDGVYTKTETDSAIAEAIADVATLEFVVYEGTLSELLQTVGDPKKIYLVTNTGSGNNTKDEYIYSEDKWELIGTTAADLSDYYTKSETQGVVDTTVANVSAGLKTGIDNNASSISSITTVSIPTIEANVDYLSGQFNSVDHVINDIKTDVSEISSEITNNNNSINGIKSDVNAISGSIDAFNNRVDDLESEHDSINSKINTNATAISALEQNTTLKANSDATNINAGLWKTALGIDTLSSSITNITESINSVASDVQIVSAKVDENTTAIASKANQTDLTAVDAKVDATSAIAITKASQADLTALTGRVEANEAAILLKASQTDVNTLSSNKQDKTISVTGINATTVEGALSELDTKYSTLSEVINGTSGSNAGVLGDIVDLRSDVNTLSADISGKADDNKVVHLSGGEIITGDLSIQGNLSTVSTTISGTTISGIDTSTKGISESDSVIPTSKAVKTAIDGVRELFTSSVIYKKVDELPAVGEKNVIYLVAEEGAIDVYVEYLYVDDKYERIGTTKADLSDYVTNESLSSTVSSINATLADKASLSEINNFTGSTNYFNGEVTAKALATPTGEVCIDTTRGIYIHDSSLGIEFKDGDAIKGIDTSTGSLSDSDNKVPSSKLVSSLIGEKANTDASNISTFKADWKNALGFIEDGDIANKYVAKNSDATLNSVYVQNGTIISAVNGDCTEVTIVAQGSNSTTMEFAIPSSIQAEYIQSYGVFTCDYKTMGVHDVMQWSAAHHDDIYVERLLTTNSNYSNSLVDWSVDTVNKKIILTFAKDVYVQTLIRLTVAFFN